MARFIQFYMPSNPYITRVENIYTNGLRSKEINYHIIAFFEIRLLVFNLKIVWCKVEWMNKQNYLWILGRKMQKTNQRTKDWTNEWKVDLKQSAKSWSVIKKFVLEMPFSLKRPNDNPKMHPFQFKNPKINSPKITLIILCKNPIKLTV